MQPSLTKLFIKFPSIRYWHIWFLLLLLRAMSYLPLPVLYAIGGGGGELAWRLHKRRRAITIRNLTACFPSRSEAEINILGRGHFRYLVIAVLLGGVAWWASETRLKRITKISGGEILDDAKKRGDNIILLAPHFAALEYGGIFLSTLAPMVSMYQRHKNPLLNAIIRDHRARFGIIQYLSRAPAKSLIQRLRGGHQFYYLPDQDPGKKQGIFAPFYGIPTATYAALGRIAKLGNAVVIPCITKILPAGGGIEIRLSPPLKNFPTNNELTDTTTMNQAIQSLITQAPAQYFWSHRRFKTRPKGEGKFY